MRFKNNLFSIFSELFLILSLCYVCFGQSGRPVPTETVVPPIQGVNTETKDSRIETPQNLYELLEPKKIIDFISDLNEAGKRGFRLEKVTSVATYIDAPLKERVTEVTLSGLLKFDGKKIYDYSYFLAEGVEAPDSKLNELAKNGWRFKEVVSLFGNPESKGGLFSVKSLPNYGNVYLLERTKDEILAYEYKLLSGRSTAWKNPTEKLNELLQTSLKEGFIPIASYYTYISKSIFSVDAYHGILLIKASEQSQNEYRFVATGTNNNLLKEITKFSGQGFRIDSLNYNAAILKRKPEKTANVIYKFLSVDSKTFEKDFGSITVNGSYQNGGIDTASSADFVKSTLIFEDNSTSENENYEYKIIKYSPKVPKEFKKNPQEYLDKLEKPQIAFQRLLAEGFIPIDLFYSDNDGVTVLFHKIKKG